MITPDIHPQAEDTAQFLGEAFGPLAGQQLFALKRLCADAAIMRVIEAFCFVHETTIAPDANTMMHREGMRCVALMIQSARSIPDDYFNQQQQQ